MKYISIIAFLSILFLASCGKKEDTQNTQQQTNPQQMTQQQTTNNGQTQQQQQPNGQTTQQQNGQTQPDGQTPNQKPNDQNQKDVKKTEENKTDANKTDANKKSEKTETDKNIDTKTTTTDNPKQQDIDFASIFSKKCAKCHGKDGHGKPDGAPNLTADSTRSKSDSKLLAILKNGIKAKNPDDDDMPAWKGKLSDDELQAAIKYIRNLP